MGLLSNYSIPTVDAIYDIDDLNNEENLYELTIYQRMRKNTIEDKVITLDDINTWMYHILKDDWYKIISIDKFGIVTLQNEDGYTCKTNCLGVCVESYDITIHSHNNPTLIWHRPKYEMIDFYNLPPKYNFREFSNTNENYYNYLKDLDDSIIGKYMFDIITNCYVKITRLSDLNIINFIPMDGTTNRYKESAFTNNKYPRLLWDKPNISNNYYIVNWNNLPKKKEIIVKQSIECTNNRELMDMMNIRLFEFQNKKYV